VAEWGTVCLLAANCR